MKGIQSSKHQPIVRITPGEDPVVIPYPLTPLSKRKSTQKSHENDSKELSLTVKKQAPKQTPEEMDEKPEITPQKPVEPKVVIKKKSEDYEGNDIQSYSSIFENLSNVDMGKTKLEEEESKDELYFKILRKIIDDPQISKKALVKNILSNCATR